MALPGTMTAGCIPTRTTASAFGIAPMDHLLGGTTIIINKINEILIDHNG